MGGFRLEDGKKRGRKERSSKKLDFQLQVIFFAALFPPLFFPFRFR